MREKAPLNGWDMANIRHEAKSLENANIAQKLDNWFPEDHPRIVRLNSAWDWVKFIIKAKRKGDRMPQRFRLDISVPMKWW